MCLPALAAIAGTGMSVFGAIQQGNAASAAAKTQQAQYDAQAQAQNRQAVLENTQGGYQARRQGEQLNDLAGRQRGQFAASGVTLEGSPTDLILDSQQEGALDLEAIRFGTGLKVDNSRYAAGVASMNATSAGQAASTATTTGYINALSPVIGLGSNQQFMTRLGMTF